MDWYYSDGRQQFGPVTESEFDSLVGAGRISASTLVWRAGMAEWSAWGKVQPSPQPSAQAAPAAAAAAVQTAPAPAAISAEPARPAVRFCSQCGTAHAPEDLLTIGGALICANCKSISMQRLREGAVPGGFTRTYQYGGFWIRFAAVLIDVVILSVVETVINLPLSLAMSGMAMARPSAPTALASMAGLLTVMIMIDFALGLLYESWFVTKKGGTPGKLALSLQVIRADGTRPGWGLSIGRHLAKFISTLTLMIGYIIAGFDDEKRALHDRICNTRVIRT